MLTAQQSQFARYCNLAQELDGKFFSILIGALLTCSLIGHSLMLSLSYIGEDYMHSITGPGWLSTQTLLVTCCSKGLQLGRWL